MDTNWADGLVILGGFGLAPDEAWYSGPLTQPWSQLFSLAPAHCQVALSWVEALADQDGVVVSEADEEVLLTQPKEFVSKFVRIGHFRHRRLRYDFGSEN
jgi:hypothetical protein